MFKVSSILPSFIKQLPSYFSPTDRKIRKLIEKLNDPTVKVVVFSENKPTFKLMRNGAILVYVLSLLKNETPQEKSPPLLKSPLYYPLEAATLSLKNRLIEKKTTEYKFDSIQVLAEKTVDLAKKIFHSLVDLLSNLSSSEQLKLQKKQIEQLTQENALLQRRNDDLQIYINSHSSFNEVLKEINNLSIAIKNQELKITSIKSDISPLLNTVRLLSKSLESTEDLLKKVDAKLLALEQKIDFESLKTEQIDKLFDAIDEQKKILKQVALDVQNVEKESNRSFLERIKDLSAKKLQTFSQDGLN